MSRQGVVHDCIVDFKCKHCHERLKPFPDEECENCNREEITIRQERAHLRCPCGRAWMCVPGGYMQPAN